MIWLHEPGREAFTHTETFYTLYVPKCIVNMNQSIQTLPSTNNIHIFIVLVIYE